MIQNRLDIVEQRLVDLSAEHDLEIPRRRSVTAAPATRHAAGGGAMSAETVAVARITPQRRAEFNKLVYQRNKLQVQLAKLDDHAADLIKTGENPLVVHAQQVSVQDQLDLVQLRLAILATRYGLTVPPGPGDPMPAGAAARPEDDANRSLDMAFARGRERAVKKLGEDADLFLESLDFGAFLND